MITTSNQITLRQIEYFLAIAEHLHFKKAAQALYISQPGLSRQIQQLESELGFPLFIRDNRNVALTKAAVFLKDAWKKHLNQLELSIDHAQLLDQGITGNLRFGYVGSAMQNAIPELLLKIRNEFPKIIFDLKEMNNAAQVASLQNNEIDLAFIRMDSVPHGLVIQPFFEDSFSLVVPRDHPIDCDNFKSLDQLKDDQFILFESSYSESYYKSVIKLFDEEGFTPNISHSAVHASTIYRLIELGFGVSIVPTSLKLGYDMNVRFIEITKTKQHATLYLARRAQTTNPVMQHLIGTMI